jgi:hypothetical protein
MVVIMVVIVIVVMIMVVIVIVALHVLGVIRSVVVHDAARTERRCQNAQGRNGYEGANRYQHGRRAEQATCHASLAGPRVGPDASSKWVTRTHLPPDHRMGIRSLSTP